MSASTTPAAAVLVAEGICVHYDGVRAVDDVHLTLEEGCVMGLIGPNGAGKSTFMGALSRFIGLTAGRVRLAGRDLTRTPPHRLPGLGIVRTFQDVATFASLSVSENVQLGALSAGLSRRDARRRAAELLVTLDLAHAADQPAGTLPTGDERRLGIARAAAAAPRFLLLDEPGAGLDDEESMALAGAISEIRTQTGCGVLLVEHDLRVIFGICDRIHVLDFGRTIASGTPDEIRADPTVIAAYLGQQGAELAKEHLHAATD
jgi:branched-chain amino acid transport system ATP-binding protein